MLRDLIQILASVIACYLLSGLLAASDPATSTESSPVPDGADELAAARDFWSFRPIEDPPVPRPINKEWCQTTIDTFVLTALEERHLMVAGPADKRTLLRRASLDLNGLPPTPDDVE